MKSDSNSLPIKSPPNVAVVSHPTLFTSFELDAFERDILCDSKANEHTASAFFAKFPKFLYLGRGYELRREVALLGKSNQQLGRVDFVRKSYMDCFWDLIELKHPNESFIVKSKSNHPRALSKAIDAIQQLRNYWSLIQQNEEIRQRLSKLGVNIHYPRMLVVAGKDNKEVSYEKVKAIKAAIEQPSLEVCSYTDLFRFAKENYERSKVIVVPLSPVLGDLSLKNRAMREKITDEHISQHLSEAIPFCVFRKDVQSRFVFANEKFLKLLNRAQGDIVGKTDYDLFPPQLAKQYLEDDRRVMDTGEPYEAIEEHTPPLSKTYHVVVTKYPIYDNNKKIIGVRGAFWDLSDENKKILDGSMPAISTKPTAVNKELLQSFSKHPIKLQSKRSIGDRSKFVVRKRPRKR